MSAKKLLLIALLLAGLIVAMIVKTGGRGDTLAAPRDLTALETDQVPRRLRIYYGGAPEEAVEVVKTDDGWVVASLYDVPADQKRAEEAAEMVLSLEGEFRSESADVLADYEIRDDEAIHWEVYGDGEKPLRHLVAGFSEGDRRGFVREAGANVVYAAGVNLRAKAGVWGKRTLKPPQSYWMNQTLFETDTERVRKIAITWPDKNIVLEWHEGTPATDDAPAVPSEWALVGGPEGFTFEPDGVETILTALRRFRVTGARDPEAREELGLVEPAFVFTYTLDDGSERVLRCSRPDGFGKDGCVTLGPGEPVYELPSSTLDRLFPAGSRFLAMKPLGIEREEIARFEIAREAGTISIAPGDEDGWKIVEGDLGLRLVDTSVDTLVGSLTQTKPSDYAEGEDPAAFGFDGPRDALTVVMKDGARRTIRFGDEAKGSAGRYVTIDDDPTVLVLGRRDDTKIHPTFARLFNLKLLQIPLKEIASFSVERENDPFTLTFGDPDWQIELAGEKGPAENTKVRRLLARLARVRAVEPISPAHFERVATVKVTTKDGNVTDLVFGPGSRMRLAGVGLDLRMRPDFVKAILPEDPASLRKKAREEEPAVEAPAPPANEPPVGG